MAFNPRDIALVTSKDEETKKLNKKLWEALEAHDAAAVEEFLEKGAQVNYKKVGSLFCALLSLWVEEERVRSFCFVLFLCTLCPSPLCCT